MKTRFGKQTASHHVHFAGTPVTKTPIYIQVLSIYDCTELIASSKRQCQKQKRMFMDGKLPEL